MALTLDDTFLAALADAVAPLVTQRLLANLQPQQPQQLEAAPKRTRKAWSTCYVKGCKNPRANRYGGFCAAEHKDLPKTEKSRWKSLAKG